MVGAATTVGACASETATMTGAAATASSAASAGGSGANWSSRRSMAGCEGGATETRWSSQWLKDAMSLKYTAQNTPSRISAGQRAERRATSRSDRTRIASTCCSWPRSSSRSGGCPAPTQGDRPHSRLQANQTAGCSIAYQHTGCGTFPAEGCPRTPQAPASLEQTPPGRCEGFPKRRKLVEADEWAPPPQQREVNRHHHCPRRR